MMMMVKPRLTKMMMKIMITIVVSADGVGLWCARTRVRFPVMLHPCFMFSPFCVALTSFEYHWNGALMEGGVGGGGVKWAHSRPQVYQLLLSRVIDVKYGCFTFTFCLYGVKQRVRKKIIVMMVMIVVVVVVVEVVMVMVRTILKRC